MAASSTFLRKQAQYNAILLHSKGPLVRAIATIAAARLMGTAATLSAAEARALMDALGESAEDAILQEYAKITGAGPAIR